MTQRVLEIVLRNKFLIIVPPVLGLILGIMASSGGQSYFSSRAGIWVDRPTDTTGEAFTDFSPYNSPAQNQANSMLQLLGTKSFVTSILRSVDGTETPPDFRYWDVRGHAFIYPTGINILTVEFQSQDPALAQKTVQAIVDQYSAIYWSQVQARAESAKAFYQEQLKVVSRALDEASTALAAFVAQNPKLAGLDVETATSTTGQNLEFVRLATAEQSARFNYEKVLSKFADSQISATSASGTSTNFLILDKPELPGLPVQEGIRTRLMGPMLGLSFGMLLGAVAFLVRWRMDRRVLLPEDLAFLSVPVMTLPTLRTRKRHWPRSYVRLATALQSGLKGAP